jgi:hypothetical protein
VDSSIRFNVSADTAQFQSGMRQVDAAAQSTAAGIKQAFSGVGSLLAGGAVVGAMTGLLKRMDDISDGARRIGISAEEFQKIGNAAELVGTSVEVVNKAMIRAGVAANKAAREGGDMAEAFARASLDPAKFAAAGLEERIKMVAEAQRAANGDARQMSELFEAIGVKAAGIDFSALADEMANVNAASSDTVEALARANDELDKAKQNATIFGANLLKAFSDVSERVGSILAQGDGLYKLINAIAALTKGNFMPLAEVMATSRTIKEMEEIELRAQAIAQLTSEGLLGGSDAEAARLIAERMEEIQNKLKGNKNLTAAINDDLGTANNLEKEKTSQLERQQRLLEQQEAKRKESIKDAQFEVELIEAKLRGDKARVAALEEQRDFDRALQQTGSFEDAANLAAAKAAERAAQSAQSSAPSGGGSRTAPPAPKTAQDYATEMRAAAAAGRFSARASSLQERGFYQAAGQAMRRADKAAQDVRDRADVSKFLRDQYDAGTMGEAYEKYRRQTGMDRDSRKEFERRTREKALTDSERQAKNEERGGGGGAGSSGKTPSEDLTKVVNDIKAILKESLPISALT